MPEPGRRPASNLESELDGLERMRSPLWNTLAAACRQRDSEVLGSLRAHADHLRNRHAQTTHGGLLVAPHTNTTADAPPVRTGNTGDARPEVCLRFAELAARWESETVFLSNSDQMKRFASYAEIVGMGWPVVGLLLERMAAPDGNWLWHMAVHDITGHSPAINPSDHGRADVVRAAWLQWGRANSLLP